MSSHHCMRIKQMIKNSDCEEYVCMGLTTLSKGGSPCPSILNEQTDSSYLYLLEKSNFSKKNVMDIHDCTMHICRSCTCTEHYVT